MAKCGYRKWVCAALLNFFIAFSHAFVVDFIIIFTNSKVIPTFAATTAN
jgi:hypothetical protein